MLSTMQIDACCEGAARKALFRIAGVVAAAWLCAKALLPVGGMGWTHAWMAALCAAATGAILVTFKSSIYGSCGRDQLPSALGSKKLTATYLFHFIMKKPDSRWGLRVCLCYFVFTMAAFLLFAGDDRGRKAIDALARNSVDFEAVAAWLLAPIYEEMLFRGALLFALRQTFEILLKNKNVAPWSVYLTALVFWLFHFPMQIEVWATAWEHGALPLSPGPFLLGIVCAALVVLDSSLWYAIVFHALANFSGVFWAHVLTHPAVFGLFYSGQPH